LYQHAVPIEVPLNSVRDLPRLQVELAPRLRSYDINTGAL
jgi:hypothetical protein